MTQKTFLETQTNVSSQYIKVAEANMKSAADEVRKVDGGQGVTADEAVNTIISTDDTWQRRGFSSRNGVVTIIGNSTGKCMTTELRRKIVKHVSIGKVNVVREPTTFVEFINTRSTTPSHRGQWNLMEF